MIYTIITAYLKIYKDWFSFFFNFACQTTIYNSLFIIFIAHSPFKDIVQWVNSISGYSTCPLRQALLT